jgi:hypothetical protein
MKGMVRDNKYKEGLVKDIVRTEDGNQSQNHRATGKMNAQTRNVLKLQQDQRRKKLKKYF